MQNGNHRDIYHHTNIYRLFGAIALLLLLFVVLYKVKVDEVVYAKGVVAGDGRFYFVKVPSGGTIDKIEELEGEILSRGDLILRFAKIDNSSDLKEVNNKLFAHKLELTWVKSILNDKNPVFASPENKTQKQMLQNAQKAYKRSKKYIADLYKKFALQEKKLQNQYQQGKEVKDKQRLQATTRLKEETVAKIRFSIKNKQLKLEQEISKLIKQGEKLQQEVADATRVLSPVEGIVVQMPKLKVGDYIKASVCKSICV